MDPAIKVLVTMPFQEVQLRKLAGVSPQIALTQREARTIEDIADSIAEAHVLYTWRVLPYPEQAPNLRWVQLHQAGIDQFLDHPLYSGTDVIFTTASGIHAINVGEHVLGQMLALAHHFRRMVEDQARGTWPEKRWKRYLPRELFGATVGIIGYGSIGRQVARLAQAFGMTVLAVKRDARHPAEENSYTIPGTGDPEGIIPDRIYPPEALHSFLSECDFVVLAAPLTQQTRALLDARALRAMKPDAFLINVARGALVDEGALIEALEGQQIAGAALDTFSEEPLPGDSPLWRLPNTIISPHVSGFTPCYNERAADLFAENLRRFVAGETLINLVDRKRNY